MLKLALLICLTSVFVFALGALALAHRSAYQIPFREWSSISPGQLKSPNAPCSIFYWEEHYEYCDTDDPSIHYAVDSSTGRIMGTSYMIMGRFSIGDLILAWGEPTGFFRSENEVTVSWGNRYAFLATEDFGPQSPVGFIEFQKMDDTYSPWHGFAK